MKISNPFKKKPEPVAAPAPTVEKSSRNTREHMESINSLSGGMDTGQPAMLDAKAYFPAPSASHVSTAPASYAQSKVAAGKVGMDTASAQAMDSYFEGSGGGFYPATNPVVLGYFASKGFMGYQSLSLLTQDPIINKGVSMVGQLATKNGFTLTFDDGEAVDPKLAAQIEILNRKFKLKKNLQRASKFVKVYGIRHTLFVVGDTYSESYYTAPFDIKNIAAGTYKGMSQVDAYWTAPLLEPDNIDNPASIDFYEPDFWIVGGNKYHKSHFVILYGPEVGDVLKPNYLYGGVSLAQMAYQRVYQAETMADEAVKLSITKRTDIRKINLGKAMGNLSDFMKKINVFQKMRSNEALSIIGTDEDYERHDTSLTDVDSVTMMQYQLAAAIFNVPVKELMGLEAGGGLGGSDEAGKESFYSVGEEEQENDLSLLVDMHHACLAASEGLNVIIGHKWNPLRVKSDKEQAEINKIKADTATVLQDTGAIDGGEIRDALIKDKSSDYTGLKPSATLEEAVNRIDNSADDKSKTGDE